MRKKLTRREFVEGSLSTAVVIASTDLPARDPFGGDNMSEEQKHKRFFGQFFTRGTCWLQPQIVDFIRKSRCTVAYDPFAGSGCLFSPVKETIKEIRSCEGLDIDPKLSWPVNDSLVQIPHKENAIIITNPPYISNYSAKRKKIDEGLCKYFAMTQYDDLYLLALDRMLQAQKYVVAIVPETFINSSYRGKNLLRSITILEDNPFSDTDTPVVVLCFDSDPKSINRVEIFKGKVFACTLGDVENCRLKPTNALKMRFNDPGGWLGVRCVDSTDPAEMLRFDFKNNIEYDWEKGIKVSSRLFTLISVDVPEESRQKFINRCNEILLDLRIRSKDIVLSPFKGNMKNGVRRRRLDFVTCRAIVEQAYDDTACGLNCCRQGELFRITGGRYD